MASLPHVLLNSVLQQGTPAYRQLIRRGFRDEWLREPELRNVWASIHKHIAHYRTIPSQRYIQERFPHFPFLDADEVLKEHPVAISDLLKENYIQVKMDDLLDKASVMNESDPLEASAWLLEQVRRLQRMATPVEMIDVSSIVSVEESEEEYERASSGDVLSLNLPWDSVQSEVLGMKPEDLILIFGRPKSMKSFLAFYMAVHAYYTNGARVLIISREMSKEQCRKRIIAFLAMIAYGPWRKGTLSAQERNDVFNILRDLVNVESMMYSPGNPHLHPCIRIADGYSDQYDGMDLVQMLIDETEPDLVVDDSMYLAAQASDKNDAMDWKAQMALTKRCKDIAKRNKIVYMATTQAKNPGRQSKKDKAKNMVYEATNLDNLAFSDSYAMNCDLAIRSVYRDNYILLGFPGFREGRLGILPIEAVPCIRFDEIPRHRLPEFELDEEVVQAIYDTDERTDQALPAGPDNNVDEEEKEIPADLSAAEDLKPRKHTKRRTK